MVEVRLKDGGTRVFADGATAGEMAAEVSVSLGKRALVCRVDGVLADLSTTPPEGARVEFVTREMEEALPIIRHDCAHVLAQAVAELFPETQPTIGPATRDGFYYDFFRETPFTPEDLKVIEGRMRELVARRIPFVREVWTREAAVRFYSERGERFKVELVEGIPEGEEIGFYRQGDFVDLCRGPHARCTGDVGDGFCLTHVAGSYWRGDARGARLHRVYGLAFADVKGLRRHLDFLEEARRRDHRVLGRVMGLFHFQDEAAGMVFWHDKGWTLYRTLEGFVRRRLQAGGYSEVRTPQLVDRRLWRESGHWDKFREHMYLAESEGGLRAYHEAPEETTVFALKPMNCPCHVQIYKQGVKSYRDLPLRMAEFGSCHRCEPSGALHGLMRVRNFVQDDAHIFCSEEQIADETVRFVRLLEGVYRDLGFAGFMVNFADRPAVRAGADAVWDRAEAALREGCEKAGVEWVLNAGEGAFYGPKLEFVLKDAIGREWQCGTWQVDFVLPERLGAEYTDVDGVRRRPVMCHRAIVGSFERFIGILLEHYAGRLPLWLAPVQVLVATITSEADGHAQRVGEALRAAGLRCAVDLRNEKINYKVREHSVAKVPVILAVGKREAEQGGVTMRRLGEKGTRVCSVEEAVGMLREEAGGPG